MKRPSFQFYPGDWAANPNLKRCTFAEKGVWLEVMCLMHDQAEYGVLRWPLKEIAEAVKCRAIELSALCRKGVLKGGDLNLSEAYIYVPRSGRKDGTPVILVPAQPGPIWYSSRMVKDEYVRTLRAEAGTTGESPKATPKVGLGEPIGGGIGPRGSSSPSSPSGNSTEAIASGGEPPDQDPKDIVFALGVSLLTAAGVKETNARSFLAMQCKGGREAEVAAVLQLCAVERPVQPIPWIQTRMNPKAGHGASKTPGKHTGFDSKNYREGIEADGSLV